MPRLPLAGLVVIALGGLWLCLWRGSWRCLGLAAIVAGFATMALTRPPDVVTVDGGRFVAARASDGHYFVAADKNENIVRSLFVSETGAELEEWPPGNGAAGRGLDCAGELCRYAGRGRAVAIVTGKNGLPGIKCREVDAIVAQVPAGFRCRSFMPVIDRIDSFPAWRRRAVARRGGCRGRKRQRSRGDRPWVPRRHSKPPAESADIKPTRSLDR
jgi:competence protein ComEC